MNKLNLKKKYILSYAFVVLAVIALSNSILIMTSMHALRTTLEQEQTERGRLLVEDIGVQVDSFLQIRNGIKTDRVFQPSYQQRYYTRRFELIDSLQGYSNYLLSDVQTYLLYCSDDLIYFDDTCADWETLCRVYWKIDAYNPLRKELFDAQQNCILKTDSLKGDLLIVLPFSMGTSMEREKTCLFFRVPQSSVEERLLRVSGLHPDEYSIAFRDELILGCKQPDWTMVCTEDGMFAIGLAGISGAAYEKLSGVQSLLLILCLGFTVISLVLAVYAGVRQYRPIGFIYQRFGGESNDQNQNELMHIETIVADTLRENARVKQDISDQMNSLMNQSKIIEQQAVQLRSQLLMLLLLGVYQGREDLPEELLTLFSHHRFAVLSIQDADESMAEAIEELSNERYRLFVIKLARQERLVVLANIEDDMEMPGLVARMGSRLGKGVSIFSSEVTDIAGVSASFIHSSNFSATQETGYTSELLLSQECQEIFKAVRMNSRESATERAMDFSAMLMHHQLPLIELRRIYLMLLKKLQNLAGELECSISEKNATALMLSMSPDEFADNLKKCITDLCEGEIIDSRPLEALELLAYIDEHACESNMSLPLLEDMFDMSRKKITAIVKNMTDMGFREYVVYQRIERAKLLLLNTKLSISTIAEMCGYESTSYFIKSFKSITDRTPGQFQKDSV